MTFLHSKSSVTRLTLTLDMVCALRGCVVSVGPPPRLPCWEPRGRRGKRFVLDTSERILCGSWPLRTGRNPPERLAPAEPAPAPPCLSKWHRAPNITCRRSENKEENRNALTNITCRRSENKEENRNALTNITCRRSEKKEDNRKALTNITCRRSEKEEENRKALTNITCRRSEKKDENRKALTNFTCRRSQNKEENRKH